MKRSRSLTVFRVVLLVAATAEVVAALCSMEPVPTWHAALFLIFLIGSDLLCVTLPRGGELSASPAAAVATALLFPAGTAVVLVAVAGGVATMLRLVLANAVAAPTALAARIMGLAVALPLLALGRPTSLAASRVNLLSLQGAAAVLFAVVFCAVCVILAQLELGLQYRTGLRATFLGLSSLVAPMYAALGSLGVLCAVVYPSMGLWAALLLLGVLLVVRHSFNLYASVRVNYQETLRALAEALEAQDPTSRGHGERTSQLALAVGRELGIHGKALESLTQAALLHDIGKLATREDSLDALLERAPIEGQPHHAVRGAEILGQVAYLKPTAELVLHHHDRYVTGRRRGRLIPLGARVIAVAGRYDTLTQSEDPARALSAEQAIKRIREEAGKSFDPRVVRALELVLQRAQGAVTQPCRKLRGCVE